MGLRFMLGMALASGVLTAGIEPRAKPADYPFQVRLENVALGAEYLVHSFSGGGRTFVTQDYLVVEVAVYPAPGREIAVRASSFSLRVNGKKQVILPQAPAFVAASLKYADWEMRRRVEAQAGPVILGRPEPVERFPGDPRPRQSRLPQPPRAPEPEDRSGQDRPEPVRADQVAIDTALPEGDFREPVSGYLYFAFKGKMKTIRSLELVYEGGTVKLL